MKKLLMSLLLLLLTATISWGQDFEIDRVEPEFWWTGFMESELQLLVYGENIGSSRVTLEHADGVRFVQAISTENPNHLFVYLNLAEAEPGTFQLKFEKEGEELVHEYTLLERQGSDNRHQGFDSSDVIYLLMPDRFANGDTSNDNIPGMLEDVDMEEPYARKGGDIQGITDNLEYIKNLGMTALWVNPIFENDMPYNYEIGAGFYHGYAATDMYMVDRRFGSNQDFVEMIQKSQEMGMKVIMDMIHNHVGTHHWFIEDLPMDSWVHNQEKVGNTNYRTDTIMDPYASESDLTSTIKGWFVDEMPDLDQRNPLLADYLIQNTLWWIEYSGIDGIRMDTHPYPYPDYMAEWARRVLEEYPDFNIVGEVWMQNVATTAWWQYNFSNPEGYNSFLPSVTDFPLYRSVVTGLNEPGGWDTGMMRIFYTLGQDFLYTDPFLNVIFVDNHDLVRFMTSIGEDPGKFRVGLAFILTTRGIPQIYYGTEIMMMGGENDPDKRRLFPGGWPNDEINAFTEAGREQLGQERDLPVPEVYNFITTITEWRKYKEVIHTGKLTHFIPENNVYIYFRHNEDTTIMVLLNGDDQAKEVNLERFEKFISEGDTGFDIISEKEFTLDRSLNVDGYEVLIVEF